MPPNMRQGCIRVGWLGPDGFAVAPDFEPVSGSDERVFAPAESEGAAVGVEVRHLRLPTGFAYPLPVLALKEGFHFCLSLAFGRLSQAPHPLSPVGASLPTSAQRAQYADCLRRVPIQNEHVKQI